MDYTLRSSERVFVVRRKHGSAFLATYTKAVVHGSSIFVAALHAPRVARIRIGRVVNAGAGHDVGHRDRCKAQLGTLNDIGEEVDLDLNVLLCSQASEVAAHEHIEVDSCHVQGGKQGNCASTFHVTE